MELKNKCELCSKDFSGLNDENINRHQIAFREKEVEKHNKIKVTEKKRKQVIFFLRRRVVHKTWLMEFLEIILMMIF